MQFILHYCKLSYITVPLVLFVDTSPVADEFLSLMIWFGNNSVVYFHYKISSVCFYCNKVNSIG